MMMDDWALDRLRAIGDHLIPAHGDFPSFGDADPDGTMLRAALHEMRRDLPLFMDLVRESADHESGELGLGTWLSRTRLDDPAAFEMLRVLLVGSYLSCRSVWDVLGYPGRVDNPVRAGEEAIWLRTSVDASDDDEGLLDAVRRRGPIYRPTPTS